jgi:hypothetical protein
MRRGPEKAVGAAVVVATVEVVAAEAVMAAAVDAAVMVADATAINVEYLAILFSTRGQGQKMRAHVHSPIF